MGTEYELKYTATEAVLEDIAGAMDTPPCVLEMETTYYDTLMDDFHRRHYTLRRRMENGVSVCTLKTPADGGARNEWETNAPDILSAIPGLLALGCPKELEEMVREGLVEVCGARFTRRSYRVVFRDSLLELALDRGVLVGGGLLLPLVEVEVELKSGTREDAQAYAAILARRYALTPQLSSKFHRALELALELALEQAAPMGGPRLRPFSGKEEKA